MNKTFKMKLNKSFIKLKFKKIQLKIIIKVKYKMIKNK